MSSFLRFAGAAALVLSFGLIARALPLGIFGDVSIPVLAGKDAICLALNYLFVEVNIAAKLKACLDVATLAELQVAIAACVAPIKACADALLQIGTGVAVDANVKLDIVACIAALITLIVQVCVQLTLKFGVSVVAAVCADLDLCVRALLASLDICIAGIVALIVKACLSVTADLMAQVNLAACAKLFLGN